MNAYDHLTNYMSTQSQYRNLENIWIIVVDGKILQTRAGTSSWVKREHARNAFHAHIPCIYSMEIKNKWIADHVQFIPLLEYLNPSIKNNQTKQDRQNRFNAILEEET